MIRKFFLGFFFVVIVFLSCKKDLESLIGNDILSGSKFDASKYYYSNIKSSTIGYQKDSLITSLYSTSGYLFLGKYNHSNFGELSSSIVAKLIHPSTSFFGDEVVDSVVLNIPFVSNSSDSVRYYGNNNLIIIGDAVNNPLVDIKMGIIDQTIPDTIYGMAVNRFDPVMTNILLDEVGYSLNLDTVYSITSYVEDGEQVIDTTDTQTPRIRVKLNTSFWQTEVFDKYENQILTSSIFDEQINGIRLYFNNTACLVYILPYSCYIEVFYHNSKNENDSYTIGFNPYNSANIFDFTENPEFSNGKLDENSSNLYLYGLNQSQVKLKIFENDEDIKSLKDSLWLINNANIVFETSSDEKTLVENLAIVKYGTGDTIIDNLYYIHYNPLGGLERLDGKNVYTFNITGHVNNIINNDSTDVDLSVIVLDANQEPRGSVIKKESIRLEISHSKQPL